MIIVNLPNFIFSSIHYIAGAYLLMSTSYQAREAGFLETYFTDPECVIRDDIFLADNKEQWVKCSKQYAKIGLFQSVVAIVIILIIILLIMWFTGVSGLTMGITVFIGLLVLGGSIGRYYMAGRSAERGWIYMEEWLEKKGMTHAEIQELKKKDPLKYAKYQNEVNRTNKWGSPFGGPARSTAPVVQQRSVGQELALGVGAPVASEAGKSLAKGVSGWFSRAASRAAERRAARGRGEDGEPMVELGDDIEEI